MTITVSPSQTKATVMEIDMEKCEIWVTTETGDLKLGEYDTYEAAEQAAEVNGLFTDDIQGIWSQYYNNTWWITDPNFDN